MAKANWELLIKKIVITMILIGFFICSNLTNEYMFDIILRLRGE
jgi:hypothetical protein